MREASPRSSSHCQVHDREESRIQTSWFGVFLQDCISNTHKARHSQKILLTPVELFAFTFSACCWSVINRANIWRGNIWRDATRSKWVQPFPLLLYQSILWKSFCDIWGVLEASCGPFIKQKTASRPIYTGLKNGSSIWLLTIFRKRKFGLVFVFHTSKGRVCCVHISLAGPSLWIVIFDCFYPVICEWWHISNNDRLKASDMFSRNWAVK